MREGHSLEFCRSKSSRFTSAAAKWYRNCAKRSLPVSSIAQTTNTSTFFNFPYMLQHENLESMETEQNNFILIIDSSCCWSFVCRVRRKLIDVTSSHHQWRRKCCSNASLQRKSQTQLRAQNKRRHQSRLPSNGSNRSNKRNQQTKNRILRTNRMKLARASSTGNHPIMLCAGLARIRSSKYIPITVCAAAIWMQTSERIVRTKKN